MMVFKTVMVLGVCVMYVRLHVFFMLLVKYFIVCSHINVSEPFIHSVCENIWISSKLLICVRSCDAKGVI